MSNNTLQISRGTGQPKSFGSFFTRSSTNTPIQAPIQDDSPENQSEFRGHNLVADNSRRIRSIDSRPLNIAGQVRTQNIVAEPAIAMGAWSSPLVVQERVFADTNRKDHLPITSNIYDKNSMAFVIEHIREEITKRSKKPIPDDYDPTNAATLMLFKSKYESSREEWHKMMDTLLNTFINFDSMYMAKNYMDYRNKFIYYILNIALSFIVIGKDSCSGDGIDNLEGYRLPRYAPPSTKSASNVSCIKLSISQKINAFLRELKKALGDICNETSKSKRMEKEYAEYIKTTTIIQTSIPPLKKNIETLKSSIPMINDPKHLKEVQDTIISTRAAVKQHFFNQSVCEEKMKEIQIRLIDSQNAIKRIFAQLDSILSFSYFVHNDYGPILDYAILPGECKL